MRTLAGRAGHSVGVPRAVAAGPRSALRERTPGALEAALLLCGVLSPAIYVGADVLAASLHPGYRYADQAVSELFAIGAPTSGLVVRLFTLSSALLLAFAVGVWWSSGRRRSLRLLAVVLACSAVNALVLWNFFPMHARGAAPSFTDTMHLALAVNPFVLASLVIGAVVFRGGLRAYTVATTAVLLGLAVYGFSYAPALAANAPTPWMGLAERVAQYAYGLWEVVIAAALWRRARTPRQSSGPPLPEIA